MKILKLLSTLITLPFLCNPVQAAFDETNNDCYSALLTVAREISPQNRGLGLVHFQVSEDGETLEFLLNENSTRGSNIGNSPLFMRNLASELFKGCNISVVSFYGVPFNPETGEPWGSEPLHYSSFLINYSGEIQAREVCIHNDSGYEFWCDEL